MKIWGKWRERRGSQQGAVLIEAIIVFTLLIAVFLALFDFFTLSSTYVNLSQIAREGVLSGIPSDKFRGAWAATTCAGVPQIDLQKDTANQHYQHCMGSAAGVVGDPTCGHYFVHWRIQKTLEAMRSIRMDPASISVATTCTPVAGTLGRFDVEITGTYAGISPFFKDSAMAVRQMGMIR